MDRRAFLGGIPSSITAAEVSATVDYSQIGQDDPIGTDSGGESGPGGDSTIDRGLFPSNATIAWITDRFVQVNGSDAPVVGHEVQTTGLVLETVTSRDEYATLSERFSWDDFDYTGENVFSELLSELAWPLGGNGLFVNGFFDEYELAWLSGVAEDYYRSSLANRDTEGLSMPSDQLFYSIYGHAPMVFAVLPADQSPDPGAVVDIAATVRHTDDGDGVFDALTGGGGYLKAETVSPRAAFRTPSREWGTGQTAEFVGLQSHEQPRLTSATTDVTYSDDLPRPVGGSVVSKRGTVTEAATDAGDGGISHRLDSESHELLVGETLSSTWDETQENSDEESGGDSDTEESVPINISIVIDTSGSMEERDTSRTENGRTLTRLGAVKSDLITLVDLIADGHRVSVVEFDSNATVVEPITLVDDAARSRLKDSVRGLNEGGDTAIGGGLQRGMETLVDETGPKSIVLLSDGRENEPPAVSDVLPNVRNEGIEVHTIGIGTGINASQLQSIAEQTGGRALLDPEIEDLRSFYFELAGDAQQRSTLSSVEEELDEGERMNDSCKVDSSCEDAQFSLSYEGSEMVLTVTDPDGNEMTEDDDRVSHRVGAAHEVWSIDDPKTGDWEYDVEVLQVDDPQRTLAQATANSTVNGDLYVRNDLYDATGFIRLQLVVDEERRRYTGASARAEIIPPSGDEDAVETVPLYDDANGPDDIASDGIYSNYYHPTESGEYRIRTIVEGGSYSGLRREFTHTAQIDGVVDDPVQLWDDRTPEPTNTETPTSGDDDSFLLLAAAGVLGGVGVLGALGAGAGLLYYRRSGGDDADTSGPDTAEADDADPDAPADGDGESDAPADDSDPADEETPGGDDAADEAVADGDDAADEAVADGDDAADEEAVADGDDAADEEGTTDD